MLTDNDRLELYEVLRDNLGERPATLFMTTISPHEHDEVATKAFVKAELEAIYRRIFWTNLGSMIGVATLVLAAQSVD